MMRRYMKFGLLVVVLGLSWMATRVSSAQTIRTPESPRERAAQRQVIRNTPLLERPNRPGHFYGNTVRRAHEKREERG